MLTPGLAERGLDVPARMSIFVPRGLDHPLNGLNVSFQPLRLCCASPILELEEGIFKLLLRRKRVLGGGEFPLQFQQKCIRFTVIPVGQCCSSLFQQRLERRLRGQSLRRLRALRTSSAKLSEEQQEYQKSRPYSQHLSQTATHASGPDLESGEIQCNGVIDGCRRRRCKGRPP